MNWDTTRNLYIEGDNLEVLKLLQTTYYRKVKMIYIDPPYNTGNDFVYADDFADPMARYKEITQQTTKSNPETNWLNMMYPRLRLAANLLRDDGVIFISIDDNEISNLRKVCDEVFGEENFIAQIIWQKRTSPDARKTLSDGHEYIVVYAKAMNNIDEVLYMLPTSEIDSGVFKNPDNDPRGPWVSSDFTAPGYRPNQMYEITTPSGSKMTPPEGRCWKNTEDVYSRYLSEGRLWFGTDGKGVPRAKTYLYERKGKSIWTWWPNSEVGHTQEATQEVMELFGKTKCFDFPKPVRLIKRVIQMATQKDSEDIILDFFSGSATTAHAVMQMNAEDGGNRRFILVQLPELCPENSDAYKAGYKNICEIGKERIRRAGRKLLEEHAQVKLTDAETRSLDTGFRVYKLDTSNLKMWEATPIKPEQINILYTRMNDMMQRVKDDRTDLDMISEIMLKLGVPLTYPVSCFDLRGKKAYAVGEDCLLLICLAENVQPEDVEAMAEYAPAKVIISRESFADNTAMANAYYILKDREIELKLV